MNEWMLDAACRGINPNTFYPEGRGDTQGRTLHVRAAQRICSGCTVRADCLEYALEHRELFGVWAGMTERERRRLRRERQREVAA